MQDLPKNFTPDQIEEPVIAQFEPAVNMTRLASCNGLIVFSTKKVYVMANFNAGMADALGTVVYQPRCFEYAEIDSYKKTGLAGYRITLKDGTELNFSNVFGKMRKGITAALEEGLAQ